MEDEIIQKICKLTAELSSQQQSNHELAAGLTTQLSDLKLKAATKNLDDDQQVHIPNPLLPEQRDEVLHNLKARLEKTLSEQQTASVINQKLEKECHDLRALVKDYELGLESVTSKLRMHASSTAEGQARLRREYEALLDAEKGTTVALFIENTTLQTQLRQLSKSLREVYKEESVDVHEQQIAQLKQENQVLLDILKLSKMPDQQEPSTERASPVLQVTRKGVVEEFFNDE